VDAMEGRVLADLRRVIRSGPVGGGQRGDDQAGKSEPGAGRQDVEGPRDLELVGQCGVATAAPPEGKVEERIHRLFTEGIHQLVLGVMTGQVQVVEDDALALRLRQIEDQDLLDPRVPLQVREQQGAKISAGAGHGNAEAAGGCRRSHIAEAFNPGFGRCQVRVPQCVAGLWPGGRWRRRRGVGRPGGAAEWLENGCSEEGPRGRKERASPRAKSPKRGLMSAEIALLPEALINQIAAGEVIERPASVIKELVENALDAGASTVRITLEEGGMGRIIIEDDGRGMSEDDAQRALLRHATSKLRDFDGLTRIRSMGFRGEAVPAIASVSRFELQTSQPNAPVGTRLRVEGGGDPEVESCEPVNGTLIRVEDLFFNVPARRKFLMRESTELKHAEEAVRRIALANPEVGFFLQHGPVTLLASPACPDDPP